MPLDLNVNPAPKPNTLSCEHDDFLKPDGCQHPDTVDPIASQNCVIRCVCCSVLQCVAVCCNICQSFCIAELRYQVCVLQCVAVCCSVLQCVAVCCNICQSFCIAELRYQVCVLQCVAVCCCVLQYMSILLHRGIVLSGMCV